MQAVFGELECVTLPPGVQPILDLHERAVSGESFHGVNRESRHPFTLTWIGGPVAFKLRSLPSELIAMRVLRFGQSRGGRESIDEVLLLRREDADGVAAYLARLTARQAEPAVRTLGEDALAIERCSWDELTLTPEVRTRLRDDFDSFFRDESWYREMRIPHRRGYLLHGPPGNGKTSAVRAMLSSHNLTAYQLRLFGRHTSDWDLEQVFRQAALNSPAVVLLEDLDRAFPRSGHRASQVSLQALLNCLDGIATEPGVVSIATANEPSLLDPAILRRPGRFDRVVLFADPDAERRREYLVRMHPPFAAQDLDAAIKASAGFSFALMREMYIMAAQSARSASRAIAPDDLVPGAEALRRGYRLAERNGRTAGFVGAV